MKIRIYNKTKIKKPPKASKINLYPISLLYTSEFSTDVATFENIVRGEFHFLDVNEIGIIKSWEGLTSFEWWKGATPTKYTGGPVIAPGTPLSLMPWKGIPKIKKMTEYKNIYRIRIGDYRAGFFYKEEVVEFVRFLQRKSIYKKFPQGS